MELLSWIIIGCHYSLIFLLCLFGLHRLSMAVRWYFYKSYDPKPKSTFATLPRVTVQIPVFNERFVAARIIDCAVKLDYPKELLHIQVVDDSTDDTYNAIQDKVNEYKEQGFRIDHEHRTNRVGFKAGALKEAMEHTDGEFIAIFDADFLPRPDFIMQSIHHFTDPKVGMLQARWEHLNKDANTLTKVQTMMLDAHFSLEQQVRCASKKLFNFNGTAGIWRTSTIIHAGHWSADTLTEDLDLSYRAQLKGWEMVYLNDLGCPAELPSNIEAFKSQQHRWAKGGTQVMLKMLKTVWRAPIKLSTKIESTFHLGNNLAYLVMLVDTLIFLIPSIFARTYLHLEHLFWLDFWLLSLSSGGHLVYLFYGQVALGLSKRFALWHLPWLLVLGVQLAFNNARAGLEALTDSQSEFVRTPKSGELDEAVITQQTAQPRTQQTQASTQQKNAPKTFYKARVPKTQLGEMCVAAIYACVFVWSLINQVWFTLPFLLVLIVGFSGVAFGQFTHMLTTHKNSD